MKFFHYNPPLTAARKIAINSKEEEVVCNLLLQYAGRGASLTSLQILDAVQLLVLSLPSGRQARMPFKEGRTGSKYVHLFNADKIRNSRPLCHKPKRFAECTAEHLTKHFSNLDSLFEKYQGLAPRDSGVTIQARESASTNARASYRHA